MPGKTSNDTQPHRSQWARSAATLAALGTTAIVIAATAAGGPHKDPSPADVPTQVNADANRAETVSELAWIPEAPNPQQQASTPSPKPTTTQKPSTPDTPRPADKSRIPGSQQTPTATANTLAGTNNSQAPRPQATDRSAPQTSPAPQNTAAPQRTAPSPAPRPTSVAARTAPAPTVENGPDEAPESVVYASLPQMQAPSAASADQARLKPLNLGNDVLRQASDQTTDLAQGATSTAGQELGAALGPVTHTAQVILIQPPGTSRDHMTAPQLARLIDTQVNNYWSSQTGGVIKIRTVEARTWTPIAERCDHMTNYHTLFEQAAKAANYRARFAHHLIIYTPASSQCALGMGTIGQYPHQGGISTIRGSQEVNPVVRDRFVAGVISHELGHNFGLEHSNKLECSPGAYDTYLSAMTSWGNGCKPKYYGDVYDIMGLSWSFQGSLNMVQAARLGVRQHNVSTITRSGTYRIQTRGLGGGGLVVEAPHSRQRYYLELRTAHGQDSWLAYNTVSPSTSAGVQVRRMSPTNHAMAARQGETLVLNFNNETFHQQRSPKANFSMPVGKTFSFAGGAFRVHLDGYSADGTQAIVQVAFGSDKITPRKAVLRTQSTHAGSTTSGNKGALRTQSAGTAAAASEEQLPSKQAGRP